MAKRLICIVLIVLFSFSLYGADAKKQKKEDDESFMQVKVKEVELFITPTFKLVLPDTSIKIGVTQDIGPSTLMGVTEYNYLYSKMNYLLKYTLNMFFPISVSLYDDLRLEQLYELYEIYGKNRYIQRNRGVGGSFSTPKIFDVLTFTQEIKNETFYFAGLDDDPIVDEGNIMLWNSGMKLELKEFKLGISFEKAIPHNISRFNYLFVNAYLNKRFEIDRNQAVTFSAGVGYVLERFDLPVWKLYRLGGFGSLMGYGIDDFQGLYKVFSRLRYDVKAFEKINFKLWWIELESIDWFTNFDAGSVGSVNDIKDFTTYVTSIGTGLDFNLSYRGKVKIKLTIAIAQALKEHYIPVFYFVQEI